MFSDFEKKIFYNILHADCRGVEWKDGDIGCDADSYVTPLPNKKRRRTSLWLASSSGEPYQESLKPKLTEDNEKTRSPESIPDKEVSDVSWVNLTGHRYIVTLCVKKLGCILKILQFFSFLMNSLFGEGP